MENKGIKVILDILKTLFHVKSSLVGDIKPHIRGHNLNRSEIFALLHIYSGINTSMGNLCKEMDLKSGSLTSVVDNLVKKGYAQRYYDSHDRRKVMVSITAKGNNITGKICSFVEENTLARIEKLTQKEKKEFFEALKVLDRTAKRITELRGKD